MCRHCLWRLLNEAGSSVTTIAVTLLAIADDDEVEHQVPDTPADILVCCGDLADFVILRVAQKCKCRHILAVKGNHDSSSKFPEPIHDLHLRTFEFGGFSFWGFCGSWKYKPRGNFLFEQQEVESLLSSFPRVDIFVAHNSPRLTHDRDDDVHIGFAAFNTYITKAR